MQNAKVSTTGQAALTGSWQELPLNTGGDRFILHSDVDLLISFLDTPVDGSAFLLPANTGLDWADQKVKVSVKGTGGTVWYIN